MKTTTTTTTKEELEEKQRRKENSLANLKPFNAMSKEEHSELSRRGALKTAEIKRQKRTMKESALSILELSVKREEAETITSNPELIEKLPEDLQLQDLMNLSLAKEVIENGNARAYEALRDTSGQRPKDQVEIEADITTEADRVLMLALKNRLGIEDNG